VKAAALHSGDLCGPEPVSGADVAVIPAASRPRRQMAEADDRRQARRTV
jgi:hypothetical protein